MLLREKGKLVYMVYRALTYTLSPLLYLHLHWRRFRGLEHPLRWPERSGRPSLLRPPGPLLWFHAVSLGEGLATIPVIKHCIDEQPKLTILMTTTTTSAFEVIKNRLPNGVLYQFAPIDTPGAIDTFLGYWNPLAIVLMESELWPNLIFGASGKGIRVALLNARMSSKSFRLWSGSLAKPLISLMLSKFSLIAPLSTLEAIRFQMLQAPPFIINFAGDLKYAVNDIDISEGEHANVENLRLQLSNRPVWMASSIHEGEEEVMLGVHKELMHTYPDIVTIIVPRHPHQGQHIAMAVQREGLNVSLRSCNEKILPRTNIYLVDTLGELRSFYRLTPIAVIGGSFLPSLAGHNISEAAAAGCVVFTGRYVGHFSSMVSKMQQMNPSSVTQVSGQAELVKAIDELFSNQNVLEARRLASKQAILGLSNGVVTSIWHLMNFHVIQKGIHPKD